MAKFIKPINLWNANTVKMIESGALKLQRGQWVKCGTDGELSRFVGYNKNTGTFDVVHRGGAATINVKFEKRCKLLKLADKMERGEISPRAHRREAMKLLKGL